MREFDKRNFFLILLLSLVWLYFVYDSRNLSGNLCFAAVGFSLYVFVTKIYEERSGFFSSLFYFSLPVIGLGCNFSGKGAWAVLFLTLAFLAYLSQKYWLFYICQVGATVVLGPSVLLFVYSVIFLHIVLLGNSERLNGMHLIRGILLVAVLYMPFVYYQYHGISLEILKNLCFSSSFSDNKYPILMNGVWLLPCMVAALLPWSVHFFRAIVVSVCDSLDVEWKNHVFLHLWWVLGLAWIVYLGREAYPLMIICFPSIAILLGWAAGRLEKNHFAGSSNCWLAADCGIGFMLLSLLWFYFGTLRSDLGFEANLLSVLMFILGGAATVIYLTRKDWELFFGLQIVIGLLNILFFYIFFYPVLSV